MLGLDVAADDVVARCMVEGVRTFGRNLYRFVDAELFFTIELRNASPSTYGIT